MKKKINNKTTLLPFVFLFFSISLVYLQSYNFSFVYDDILHILQNQTVQSGINIESLKWAFYTDYAANWYPLTWISHMLDCQIFGLNAGGHHLVNVFIHFLNSCLLFCLLLKLSKKSDFSIFVTALFALHPLHVESVAWISERKDLLSTLFFFLSLYFYVSYFKETKIKFYWISFCAFILSLLSKSMFVTCGFVLILLDFYMISKDDFSWNVFLKKQINKIPFFILAMLVSYKTFNAQRKWGALDIDNAISFSTRILNAISVYFKYIFKMFFPFKLAVPYPHTGTPPLYLIIISISFFALFFYLAFINIKKRRHILICLLFYLGILVPVIGIVQVGAQEMADRYTYVSLIAIFIIIVSYLHERLTKKNFYIIFAISTIFFGTLSFLQVRHWKNYETLFSHSTKIVKNNYLAHNDWGLSLAKEKKFDEALEHFRKATKIKPYFWDGENNIGAALMDKKDYEAAIKHYYEKILKINPKYESAYYNIALAYTKLNQFDKALKFYDFAFKLNPSSFSAGYNAGFILMQQEKYAQANEYLLKCKKLQPNDVGLNYMLGYCFLKTNDIQNAKKYFEHTLLLDPSNQDAQNALHYISTNLEIKK